MGVQKNSGPGQCAWTPRGAEPEIHGALLQGRGAGGRAEMAAAGRLAWECHFLTCSPRDFHRLLRCLQEFSSAWKRGRARLSACRDAQERTRARGTRPPREARRPRRAAWVLFPAPSILPSDGFSKTKSKHPVSRPPSMPSFFSSLTNPRIIQLRKCWKEVSEGGGRRVEIFGSSVLVCVWSGGSRWVG